jgi:hypothetical protein
VNEFASKLMLTSLFSRLMVEQLSNVSLMQLIPLFALMPRSIEHSKIGAFFWQQIWIEGAKGGFKATPEEVAEVQQLLVTFELEKYLKIPARS